MNETAVSALLTASITGAGLVLAIYALIIPITRRFFSYRAKDLHEQLQELKEKIHETDTCVSQDDLAEMKTTLENIGERQSVPSYLGFGAGLTFFGYMVATLLSFLWLIEYNQSTVASYLPFTFFISTIFFLLLGLFSIKDISGTMKREFEDLKQKVEDAKKESHNIKTYRKVSK